MFYPVDPLAEADVTILNGNGHLPQAYLCHKCHFRFPDAMDVDEPTPVIISAAG